MATQPSAAQMAARKTFAEMAKAGAFKKRAAPAARKNPAAKRKKNPFDDMVQPAAPKGPKNAFKRNPSGTNAGATKVADLIVRCVNSGVPFDEAVKIARTAWVKNPTPAQVATAKKQARAMLNYPDPIRVTARGVVRRNPVKRKNPTMPAHRNPSAYCVHRVKTDGEPGALLATFASLPLAKEYAKAYAEAHGAQVGIVGKR